MYRLVLVQHLVILALLFQGTACFSNDSAWNTYMESGTAASKQGKYQEARASFASAVKESEKFGARDPRLAVSCSYLALMNKKLGDLSQAELLYKRAVSIFEYSNGPNDREVATNVEGLAGVYHAQGKNDLAEPLYRRALAICEKTFGPEDPHVAESLNHLATMYRDQRRYSEAEPLYVRAEAIDRKKLGLDHPDLGKTIGNLGVLYREQGNYPKAEALIKQALTIFEKDPQHNNRDIAVTLYNLAMLYHAQGKFVEAESVLKRAISINEQLAAHPEVATWRQNLSMMKLFRCAPLIGEEIEGYKTRAGSAVRLVEKNTDKEKDTLSSYTFEPVLDAAEQSQTGGHKWTYVIGTNGGRINRAVFATSVEKSADPETLLPFGQRVASFVLRNNPALLNNKANAYNVGKQLGILLREIHQSGGSKEFEFAGCQQRITVARDGDGALLVTMVSPEEKGAPDIISEAQNHKDTAAVSTQSSVGGKQSTGGKAASDGVQSARTAVPDDPQFKQYLGGVMSQIGHAFFPPVGTKRGSAKVLFKVHPSGDVSDVRIGASSGVTAIDEALVEAVQKASPFSALPAGYAQYALVRFEITMNGPLRSMDIGIEDAAAAAKN